MRRFPIDAMAICAVVVGAAAGFAELPTPPATGAPSVGMRVAAEWEPVVGVLIGWPRKLPRSLIIEMARDADLYVTVRDKSNQENAQETLKRWGIDVARLHFIITQQGDGYHVSRDWGPFAVFDQQGNHKLVDGRFLDYPLSGIDSSQRLFWLAKLLSLDHKPDDAAPAAVADVLGATRTELPVALTGGNVFFDGRGTAFATQIIVDENIAMGISKNEFLRIAREELGVTQFHILPNYESCGFENSGLAIQHIDCVLKLLDEERILIKRAPQDHPDFRHIEAVAEHLSKLTNVYGRPYTLLRIDTPRYFEDYLANYTNSLILNNKIFVPVFRIAADEQALNMWRAAMPGYEVLGFALDKEQLDMRYTDAIHCRTRAIWDPKMLYMSHKRLDAVVPSASRFTIETHIRDYSRAGLVTDKTQLAWRTAGSSEWNKIQLRPTSREHSYSAMIGGVKSGDTVEYYLSAADRSGRQESLPRTAPKGHYSFTIE